MSEKTRTENYGSAIRPEDRPATPKDLGNMFGVVKASPTLLEGAIPVNPSPFGPAATVGGDLPFERNQTNGYPLIGGKP
jgi:hypothetical protein